MAVHGMVDAMYLLEMAKKIKRGKDGQIARGFATGGVTFGYRTVPVLDPSGRKDKYGNPARLGMQNEIEPAEAVIVVWIFQMFADGLGTGRIVARLNRDRITGPRGRPSRAGQSAGYCSTRSIAGR